MSKIRIPDAARGGPSCRIQGTGSTEKGRLALLGCAADSIDSTRDAVENCARCIFGFREIVALGIVALGI